MIPLGKKLLDHVSIVEKVENGIVYTVEGNSGDACRQRQYSVGYYEILGYGVHQHIKIPAAKIGGWYINFRECSLLQACILRDNEI